MKTANNWVTGAFPRCAPSEVFSPRSLFDSRRVRSKPQAPRMGAIAPAWLALLGSALVEKILKSFQRRTEHTVHGYTKTLISHRSTKRLCRSPARYDI